MFKNPGRKIKNLAMASFIVETIAAIIGGIVLMCEDYVFLGFVTILGGFFVAYVTALLLYGFGELVENSAIHKSNNQVTTEKSSSKKVAPSKKEPVKNQTDLENLSTSYECAKGMIICPNCGIEQIDKNTHCWSCDQPLK